VAAWREAVVGDAERGELRIEEVGVAVAVLLEGCGGGVELARERWTWIPGWRRSVGAVTWIGADHRGTIRHSAAAD
jgi:hypothetical protein